MDSLLYTLICQISYNNLKWYTNYRYQIMLSCWNPNPNVRPAFWQLKTELEKLLEETRTYIDLTVDVSEDYFNEATVE